jgi:hypothetical protein
VFTLRIILNTEHFIKSTDVQFTVYSAGHLTPWSSSPATITLISIRLMLHFLFLITLYIYILLHVGFPWWHDLCTLQHFHSNATVLLRNSEFVTFPW